MHGYKFPEIPQVDDAKCIVRDSIAKTVGKFVMAKKQKMSQLCEGLNIYPQVLQNVRVADKAEC